MASLQERNGSYRILFSHHGKLHAFTLGKVARSEAEKKARQVDYLLMRLKQRLILALDQSREKGLDFFKPFFHSHRRTLSFDVPVVSLVFRAFLSILCTVAQISQRNL